MPEVKMGRKILKLTCQSCENYFYFIWEMGKTKNSNLRLKGKCFSNFPANCIYVFRVRFGWKCSIRLKMFNPVLNRWAISKMSLCHQLLFSVWRCLCRFYIFMSLMNVMQWNLLVVVGGFVLETISVEFAMPHGVKHFAPYFNFNLFITKRTSQLHFTLRML